MTSFLRRLNSIYFLRGKGKGKGSARDGGITGACADDLDDVSGLAIDFTIELVEARNWSKRRSGSAAQ